MSEMHSGAVRIDAETLPAVDTFKDFREWLRSSEVGDAIVYFSGDLATDRTVNRDWHDKQRVDRLAWGAWDAAYDGWVRLVQCKMRPGFTHYVAVRCSAHRMQYKRPRTDGEKMWTDQEIRRLSKSGYTVGDIVFRTHRRIDAVVAALSRKTE